jgi:serine/threonine-protein kinase RIO1
MPDVCIGFGSASELDQSSLSSMQKLLFHLCVNGCVHRDLSHRHFLVDNKGEVFIIDFGYAVVHGTEDSFAGES